MCPCITFHAQRRREGLSSDLMDIWLWCSCSTQAIWESGSQGSLVSEIPKHMEAEEAGARAAASRLQAGL